MTRHEILKTYKLYLGGAFPRTESGRYITVTTKDGKHVANICRSSRKDLRNAVKAAGKAQAAWQSKTAFNRSQILYRVAEVMEGRKPQLLSELVTLGWKPAAAEKEISTATDMWVYFAGWCDKYQQVYGSINPVASSHFNFSSPEPTGIVGIIAPEESPLVSLSVMIASAIAGGNAVVALSSPMASLSAITLAEIIHASDVPGGVVNILTGQVDELALQYAAHMEINALIWGDKDADIKPVAVEGAINIKRIFNYAGIQWQNYVPGPEMLMDLQEIKTTWHPIEIPIGGGGAY